MPLFIAVSWKNKTWQLLVTKQNGVLSEFSSKLESTSMISEQLMMQVPTGNRCLSSERLKAPSYRAGGIFKPYFILVSSTSPLNFGN